MLLAADAEAAAPGGCDNSNCNFGGKSKQSSIGSSGSSFSQYHGLSQNDFASSPSQGILSTKKV